MNYYTILSPTGRYYRYWASSIYEAIQRAVAEDGGRWGTREYFKINKLK